MNLYFSTMIHCKCFPFCCT